MSEAECPAIRRQTYTSRFPGTAWFRCHLVKHRKTGCFLFWTGSSGHSFPCRPFFPGGKGTMNRIIIVRITVDASTSTLTITSENTPPTDGHEKAVPEGTASDIRGERSLFFRFSRILVRYGLGVDGPSEFVTDGEVHGDFGTGLSTPYHKV